MNKFYTKKELANIVSELEYTDEDKDIVEIGYDDKSLREYLLKIFTENIDRGLTTDLTSSEWSAHENISDLALYYFKVLAYSEYLDNDNDYYFIQYLAYILKYIERKNNFKYRWLLVSTSGGIRLLLQEHQGFLQDFFHQL